MDYFSIDVPVRLWMRVDACLDNSVAIDVVDLIMESVIIGYCARDEGWRASAAYEGECDEYGWPPPDHRLQIVLQRPHWDWIITQLDRWEPYSDDDGISHARDLIHRSLHAT